MTKIVVHAEIAEQIGTSDGPNLIFNSGIANAR